MKLSNFVILVALGVIFFSLMGGRFDLRLPAALSSISSAFVPGMKPAVKVDKNLPKPSVHVRELSFVRGKVLAVQDDTALVDCDARGTVSKESALRWNQDRMEEGDTGKVQFASMAQAEADRQMFGELVVLDTQDNLRAADFIPPKQQQGKILLRGLPVSVGDAVHVIIAPLGKNQSGAAIYTARFVMPAGTWMWKPGTRTMLDQRNSGKTALEAKQTEFPIPKQVPPAGAK